MTSAAPGPIVLRPTAPAYINNDPAWGPFDGPSGHRERVLAAARWWATCPEKVAYAAAAYMLDLFDSVGTPVVGLGPTWERAMTASGDHDLFRQAPDQYLTLTRVGVDPTVLLALRGTPVPDRDRLLIASAGLAPAEAHALHTDDALDLDAVRTMIALRRRR